MSILYVLLALLLLGILIIVHEFGHFASSRLCGIPVKEFSIGFGPKLLQWKSRKQETLFTLRALPLGGYCMYYGDTDDDPQSEKQPDPRRYGNAPVWKRMVSIFCGPAMNFVLAFVVAVAMMAAYGVTDGAPMVYSVEPGMPAEAAGLLPGDIVVRVGDRDMRDESVSVVSEAIGQVPEGEDVHIAVERDGVEISLSIQPLYDQAEGRYRIGILLQQGFASLPAGQVLPAAWDLCRRASTAILDSLGKLVTTGEGLEQTTGPVGVVQLVAQQTREGGLEMYLYLIVLISINLGLINLLPIPGLDGSRLVFLALEAIRKKPVSQRVEAAVHLAGYAFLIALMLFFTFGDILRIVG